MTTLLKNKLFYLLLATTAVLTLFVYVGMPALGIGGHGADKENSASNASSSSKEHDETNSDGHHADSKIGNAGSAIDLTSQSQVSIDIKDFAYSQQNIKIKKGTTVTWTNLDTIKHNVMKEHAQDGDPHAAVEGDEIKADILAGPLLAKGESYSFTFNKVSDNPYHCSPHPNMKGTVYVVE